MNRLYTSYFIIIILCVTSIVVVFAQERAPGVSIGNEFTYSQKSHWASNNSKVSMPAGLAEINMTDYYKVTVTGVSGSNVSIHTKWQFLNGTSIDLDGTVSTETTAYQGGYWIIIGSNLNQGDRVHPNSPQDQSIINETVPWTYQGYQRQTNHLKLDYLNEESDIPNATYAETVDTYFDRQTGALVYLNDIHSYHNPDITYMATLELTSQNAWIDTDSAQNSSFLLAIAIIVILASVLTLGILVYRRMKSTKKLNSSKIQQANNPLFQVLINFQLFFRK